MTSFVQDVHARKLYDFFFFLATGAFLATRAPVAPLSVATNNAADAGIPALPSRRICLALNFRPYSFSVALPSGRNVEPSSEIPANSPRDREIRKHLRPHHYVGRRCRVPSHRTCCRRHIRPQLYFAAQQRIYSAVIDHEN